MRPATRARAAPAGPPRPPGGAFDARAAPAVSSGAMSETPGVPPPPPGEAPPPVGGGFSPAWHLPPRRRSATKVFLLGASLVVAFVAAILGTAAWIFRDRETRPRREIADEFIRWIKLGEETPEGADPEAPVGYARAYGLLSPAAKERVPFESFYREFLSRTQEFGPVLAGEAIRGLRSGGREYAFRLVFGDPRGSPEAMTPFVVTVTLVRDGAEWLVDAYDVQPLDPRRRGF